MISSVFFFFFSFSSFSHRFPFVVDWINVYISFNLSLTFFAIYSRVNMYRVEHEMIMLHIRICPEVKWLLFIKWSVKIGFLLISWVFVFVSLIVVHAAFLKFDILSIAFYQRFFCRLFCFIFFLNFQSSNCVPSSSFCK